jgi:hypothetical protein
MCFASYLGGGRVRNCAALLPLAAAAVLVMTGCSAAASAGAVIIVRDNANGKTVHVPAGDRVELILSSTYWMVHGKSAPAVLRQDGPTRLLPRPKSCSRIPGLGCIPVKTSFTALAAGKAVITASRTSCGEARRCVGGQGRFRVTVVVVK